MTDDTDIIDSYEKQEKLERAQEIVQHRFARPEILLAAITHPSANEGRAVKYSYERLEFLGDSILGALVADRVFETYHDIDDGGLTRIKVALVSGTSLSQVGRELGLSDVIFFGSSERGTGKRGLTSALENVYEALVAALFIDGGMDCARVFVERTLIPRMSLDMAKEPENPKSLLQEKLQVGGITPTYKLVKTQGPPHDRTFVSQVFAGSHGLAQGSGRTKKEAESQAAKSTLARLSEFFGIGVDECERARKGVEHAQIKAHKTLTNAQEKADRIYASAQAKVQKAVARAALKQKKHSAAQLASEQSTNDASATSANAAPGATRTNSVPRATSAPVAMTDVSSQHPCE